MSIHESRFTKREILEITKNLFVDSLSTSNAILALLETEEATVNDLKCDTGLLEWFAREKMVTLGISITDTQDHVSGGVVEHIFNKLVRYGYVGVSVKSVKSKNMATMYSKRLSHSFVLVIPKGWTGNVCKDCYVVDAYAGYSECSRMYKIKNWREKVYSIISLIEPGSNREKLWTEVFNLHHTAITQRHIEDVTDEIGVKVKVFY
jgi:hypothetical protein